MIDIFVFKNETYSKSDIEQALEDLYNNKYEESSFTTNKIGNIYDIYYRDKIFGVKRLIECLLKNFNREVNYKDFNSSDRLRASLAKLGFDVREKVNRKFYWINQKDFENEFKNGLVFACDNPTYKCIQEINLGDTIVCYNLQTQEINAQCIVVELPKKKYNSQFEIKVNYSEFNLIKKDNFIEYLKNTDIDLFKNGFPFNNEYDSNQNYIFRINKNIYDEIISFGDKKEINKELKPKIEPKNQILYGPSGTGKTFSAVIKAMSIIDGVEYDNNDYEVLEERFNKILSKKSEDNSKQIEFITFHQAYSYEEFVEGIKPDVSSEGLNYVLEDGIFKQICQHALEESNFDKVYNQFINDVIAYYDDNDEIFTLKTKTGKTFGIKINSNNNITLCTGPKLQAQGSITKETIKKQNANYWVSYTTSIYEHLIKEYGLKISKNTKKPYVLIIDEINRANISKVFGELITLLEEDKREKFYVTLPYTKKQFTVPKNLYIIGTMNTADKSLALLDSALRRRFVFIPVYPKYDVIKDDIKRKFLEDLNKSIINFGKKDADYLIGHSYFMDDRELKDIINFNIIPLLIESFNGNCETVKKILNLVNIKGIKITEDEFKCLKAEYLNAD